MFAVILFSIIIVGAIIFAFTPESDGWYGKKYSRSWGERLGIIGLSTIFGTVGTLIITMIVGILAPKGDSTTEALNLRAIATNSGTSGSFFLGTGYIDEEQSYIYYAENEDGSLYMDSVSIEDAVIREDEDTQPYIEVVEERFADWLFPFDDLEGEWDYNYVIHIPPNSIKPMVDMSLPD